jgi:predicted dehydrogenase
MVIGAGKMGAEHVHAFSRLPQVEIVAIASRSGVSAQKLASALGIDAAGDNWKLLAQRHCAQACVIAVSHEENERITREALQLGLHVLAEKPAAFSGIAVEGLAELAAAQNRIAMAAMNRRFYASVQAALHAVHFYGPLRGITALLPDPVQSRRAAKTHADFVLDRWAIAQTLHAIDLLRLAAGEVVDFTGQGSRGSDGEANWAALVRFDSDVAASISSFSSAGGAWEIRLHAESAEAILSPLERGTLRIGQTVQPLPDSQRSDRDLKAGLPGQARAFIEAIECGSLGYPCSSLADHARSVELTERLAQLADAWPCDEQLAGGQANGTEPHPQRRAQLTTRSR